jgi:hypothetical protein
MVDIVQYNGLGHEIYPSNITCPRFVVHSGNLAIVETPHGPTVAFMYLVNPVGNTKDIGVYRVMFRTSTVTALVCLTAPRVTVERMTFTGTAVGAARTVVKLQTASADTTAIATTSIDGLVNASGPTITAFMIPSVMTAVGSGNTVDQEFVAKTGEVVVLAPGEGLAIRQTDAGTPSDTRKAVVSLFWEEHTR